MSKRSLLLEVSANFAFRLKRQQKLHNFFITALNVLKFLWTLRCMCNCSFRSHVILRTAVPTFISKAMNCQDQAMSCVRLMDECVCGPINTCMRALITLQWTSRQHCKYSNFYSTIHACLIYCAAYLYVEV